MRITESKLRKMIRSIIKEASGGASIGGASRRYLKGVTKSGGKVVPVASKATKKAQSKLKVRKNNVEFI